MKTTTLISDDVHRFSIKLSLASSSKMNNFKVIVN